MNENIDLTKILKNCPKDWVFYSIIYGNVYFHKINDFAVYPIIYATSSGSLCSATAEGSIIKNMVVNAHYSQAKSKETGLNLLLLGIRKRSLTQRPCSHLIGY